MVQKFTPTHWLICIIASIGFAFDIYELLMLPLILKPALASLAGLVPGNPEYVHWARMMFFIPALFGGVFGLLGGWLTDRLGRRRVLTWSILIYAFGAFAAGFSETPMQLLICRCFVFTGVCVEFVAAVAWLAELFPDKKQKEKVLGYTQAFSSIGGLLVAWMNSNAITLAPSLPAIHGAHDAWRYTLISGLLPAIPLILIRPFLPESPVWAQKRAAGTLRRPSIAELFQGGLAKTTITTTLLFACCYGIAFGAIQHLPQMIPGMKDTGTAATVALKEAGLPATPPAAVTPPGASTSPAAPGTAIMSAAPAGAPDPAAIKKAAVLRSQTGEKTVANVTKWQEIGGLSGRVLLAVMAAGMLSRRSLLRLFAVPAAIFIPGFFFWLQGNAGTPGALDTLKWGVFVAGLLLVSQFSFLGNYIPRIFPVHLRGTGESFAANIGGRVIGTSLALVFFGLTDTGEAGVPASVSTMAGAAAWIALVMGVAVLALSFFLTEPAEQDDHS